MPATCTSYNPCMEDIRARWHRCSCFMANSEWSPSRFTIQDRPQPVPSRMGSLLQPACIGLLSHSSSGTFTFLLSSVVSSHCTRLQLRQHCIMFALWKNEMHLSLTVVFWGDFFSKIFPHKFPSNSRNPCTCICVMLSKLWECQTRMKKNFHAGHTHQVSPCC